MLLSLAMFSNIPSSFLDRPEKYSIIEMYSNLLIYSLVDGHLDPFQMLAARNVQVKVVLWTCVFIFLNSRTAGS